jgi:hypothetical protein
MLQAEAAFFACRIFLIIAYKRDSVLIFRTPIDPIDVLCFSDDLPKVLFLLVILQNTSWPTFYVQARKFFIDSGTEERLMRLSTLSHCK